MKMKVLWSGRLPRVVLCGLLTATALPATAGADPLAGAVPVPQAPVIAPAPAPVTLPSVAVPAIPAPVASPAVSKATSMPKPTVSAAKAVGVRVSATARRSKGGETSARADAKAQAPAAGAVSASASGSFLAESETIVPINIAVLNMCFFPFESVVLTGRLHTVTDDDGRIYNTLQATGITPLGVKYTVVETRHAHEFGGTFTQYDRLVRAKETDTLLGGDDFFLKTTFPPLASEFDCR